MIKLQNEYKVSTNEKNKKMTKKIRKMTKKNRKIMIMMATGAIFLVATSLTIAVVIVRASFNSYTQDVRNAKMTLEKLTPAQKTVDLTNDANQKFPSEIAPTIKSIKALNALIKGVIIAPSGVIYTPNVVKIDNDKKELVIEIEIEKGNVKDKFRFIVTKFITKVEIDIIKALARINDKTISGDENKWPSEMAVEIKALVGFPKETDGVEFDITSRYAINKDGTLLITLKATKGSIFKKKKITISGFKKRNLESDDYEDVFNALFKIDYETISGDENKLPSEMTGKLIKALAGFPKETNGIELNIPLKYPINEDGRLVMTISATKGSAYWNRNVTISGFKSQIQADQNIVNNSLDKINNATISGFGNSLPSEMTKKSIKALVGFPKETDGVEFDITSRYAINKDGTLLITLKATKGSVNAKKKVTISGFKKRNLEPDDYEDVFNAMYKINHETISGDKNKLPSEMTDKLIKDLKGFPQEVNGVKFNESRIFSINDKIGTLFIYLIAKKRKTRNLLQIITISGFKKQPLSD